MGTFPYNVPFAPVVSPRDYVVFMGRGYNIDNTYLVTGLEPIQPYILDVLLMTGALPASVTTLAANGSTNDRTADIGEGTMRNYLQVDNNMFAQYRVSFLDDFLLKLGAPGQANIMYSTVNATTYMHGALIPHRAVSQLTTAPATDTLIWANSSNTSIAGEISGMTPTRKSRLVGLAISCSGATTVRFGDASVGGGTTASAANNTFAIPFVTQDYILLGKDEIPEDLYFNSGLVWQQSQAVTTTVTAIMEEDDVAPFVAQYKLREGVTSIQSNEFFVLEDACPTWKAINPLAVSQGTARVSLAGFQYTLLEKAAPPGLKPIQIPISSLRHAGLAQNE